MEEGLWGLSWALPKPDVPGPSRDEGMASKMPTSEGEVPKNEPHDQGESTEDQTLFEPNPEDVAGIVISGDNDSDLTLEGMSSEQEAKLEGPGSTPVSSKETGDEGR